jgi:hypothetical protein
LHHQVKHPIFFVQKEFCSCGFRQIHFPIQSPLNGINRFSFLTVIWKLSLSTKWIARFSIGLISDTRFLFLLHPKLPSAIDIAKLMERWKLFFRISGLLSWTVCDPLCEDNSNRSIIWTYNRYFLWSFAFL